MNYVPINKVVSSNGFNIIPSSEEININSLSYLLGGISNYTANFIPTNGNVISFDDSISGSNIANVVSANSFVTYNTNYGGTFYSMVTGSTSNTITLQDNFITQVPNVGYSTVTASSNNINISSLTKAWQIATGNTVSHISDFINTYDQVSFDGNTYYTVIHVDDVTSGNSIIVNTTIATAHTGYLTLSKNVSSSNIFVSEITTEIENITQIETVELVDQNGNTITTEDGRILILG
jgi:hypothetical protein